MRERHLCYLLAGRPFFGYPIHITSLQSFSGGNLQKDILKTYIYLRSIMEETEKIIGRDDLRFLPVLPLKNVVAMPRSIVPVIVGRDISLQAVEYALKHHKEVFVTAQRSQDTNVPTVEDLYPIGTRAVILQATRMQNGTLKILIEGIIRARIEEVVQREEFIGVLSADIASIPMLQDAETEALWRTLVDLFKAYIDISDKVPKDVLTMFKDSSDLDHLADTVAMHVQMKLEERQRILETIELKERVHLLISQLKQEIEIIKTEQKIRKRVQSQVEKHQKDYYLHEQMRAIQRELGKEGLAGEVAELRKKAKKLRLPADVAEKVELELNRLEQMQATSPESSVSRNYIEWILALPWHETSKDRVSISEAEGILSESHAGMKKAKERVLEFIAIKKFAKDKLKRSPIICLAGPPGVGKTSLARSIAKALGREFVRISLGGMRDEAEIRGHRRTYIGAMPGKIIQAMRRAKTVNPVMLLDEVDKMSMDFRGDPASALLEVLDPELNTAFADYFLEVDYDLSKVMFITTANVIDNIPYPLLDRMEVIQLAGYSLEEKRDIARSFLIPRLLVEHSLSADQFEISDELLLRVIDEYTKEAGVRQLERIFAKIIRKSIQLLLEFPKMKKVTVSDALIEEWLGSPRFKRPEKSPEERIGVVTGLAWTEAGGDILEIEVTILKGKGSLQLTGQLGEVMRESAEAALSYVRSRAKELGLKEDFYSDKDIHIHVPEGAIPKDGPSAGISMTVALVSALTQKPVKKALAMTGEVTLRGRVLPVGGLKEKLLAATRFGFTMVIVPLENKSDIKEFEKELDASLKILYADTMDTVLSESFTASPFVKENGTKSSAKKEPKSKRTPAKAPKSKATKTTRK